MIRQSVQSLKIKIQYLLLIFIKQIIKEIKNAPEFGIEVDNGNDSECEPR